MRVTLGLALAAAFALAPASASAGIVYIHNEYGQETLEYHAAPGERNTVDIHWQLDGRWVDVYDNSARITTELTNVYIPDPSQDPPQESYRPCQLIDDHHAHCVTVVPANPDPRYPNWTNPIPYARVYLGDRDDSFRPSWGSDPFSAYVYGEDGNDSITLGPGPSFFGSVAYGGPGDDLLVSDTAPGAGANLLVGEDGNDRLEADNGVQESALCGPGEDYAHVDGHPEDGVLDCETVVRGSLAGSGSG
jgi:hypothetical protein